MPARLLRWLRPRGPQRPATPEPEQAAESEPAIDPSALFRARTLVGAALVASAAFLIWHSLRFNFVTDDAYISFVYSRNLAEHGELTFNLGDRVEGYSNFSWTVLLAALMRLGIDPEIASRVLGTACGVGVLLVAARLTRRALPARASAWSALPAALLAASSGFACWSSGGLESQLFTLLCALSFDRLAVATSPDEPRGRRAWLQLGLLLALAAMTRPEGLLLAAVIGGCALAGNLSARRFTLATLVPPAQRWAALAFLALWLPWFVWRCWYYGWPFPNTYYVKATGAWQPPELAREMWRNGAYYLLVWARQTGLLWASPLLAFGLVVGLRRRPRAWFVALVAFAAIYLLYTASVGGDFMGLHRFILPVFVAAAIAITLGAQALAQWLFARPQLGAVLALPLLLAFALAQQALTSRSVAWGRFDADHGIDSPAFLMIYTRDRAEVGRALRGCLRDDDFSIVGGAGAQPYFGHMRAIDVFGLVSERVAHREPRIRARAGHTKFASDALLLELDPTFVFSCYAIHATAAPPTLPCAGPWLSRGFELVTLHVPAMRQSGTYYSFLARASRGFQCPGRVP
jgi:arabinofuranosyltransferase